jgi:ABC-type bacteriocin/lantibiotic exporter with double-glycine peptidase domain
VKNPLRTTWLRPDDWRILRRWFHYLRPFRSGIAAAALLLLLATALQLATPLLTGFVIDRVLLAHRAELLHLVALLLVGVTLAYMLANLARSFVLMRIKMRVALAMHQDIARKLHKLTFTYTNRKETGYLASRVIDDPTTVNEFMTSNLLAVLQHALTFTAALALMFWLSWQTALIALMVLPLYLLLGSAFVVRLRELNRQGVESGAERSRVLYETLSGLYAANAAAAEPRVLRRFYAKQKDLARKQIAQFILASKISFLRGFAAALGPIAVLWYGGLAVIRGQLTIGELVAFGAIFGYLFNSAQSLSATHISLQKVFVALERIYEVLDQVPDVAPPASPRRPDRLLHAISLEDVRFAYEPGKEVLRGVDASFTTGKVHALVGKSGAGKSTIAHLLMRFYDPTEGRILIDGADLREFSLSALRRWIALVPQEVFLFSATVEENIRFGKPDATRTQVLAAAELADASGFIEDLPSGYHTMVGERGFNLSGGQRQRLGIARALLGNPRVLLLDEAASAVDGSSEMAICRTVHTLSAQSGMTAIVIAHRLSTIVTSDRIHLLDQGRLLVAGEHAELLATCAAYRELIRFQFGPEAAFASTGPAAPSSPVPSTGGSDEPASVASGEFVFGAD